jgi:hypothetical protein
VADAIFGLASDRIIDEKIVNVSFGYLNNVVNKTAVASYPKEFIDQFGGIGDLTTNKQTYNKSIDKFLFDKDVAAGDKKNR